jgi:hypothetical protein
MVPEHMSMTIALIHNSVKKHLLQLLRICTKSKSLFYNAHAQTLTFKWQKICKDNLKTSTYNRTQSQFSTLKYSSPIYVPCVIYVVYTNSAFCPLSEFTDFDSHRIVIISLNNTDKLVIVKEMYCVFFEVELNFLSL